MVSKGVAYGTAVFGTLMALGGIYYGVTKKPEYGAIPITIPGTGPGAGVWVPAQLQPRGETVFNKKSMGW